MAEERETLLLDLDGFTGPLDLLLALARTQEVDLARISILALVEQFLAVIEGAQRVRLELAAEWLVMAAWLAWLKSRLLLPAGTAEAEEGETAAEALAGRLAELAAMRRAASWLDGSVQLGRDVFARGAPEERREIDRSELALDLGSLIHAYLAASIRAAARRRYRVQPLALWQVPQALARLKELLGILPEWTELACFLPERAETSLERRAALASTFVAGLELARDGEVLLRQEAPFGPILLRRPVAAQWAEKAENAFAAQ